ncbi:hypothetical protein H7K24_14675 [Mycobacterium fragae]|jgi:hypothetical protein|uniref:Uncharacterized protein n=1 Tax=Mycobacterium fragae TaxID=1260918 RepID=A0A1X1UIP9_9MYCO|nr:hypothetical protein [Mycobacterium fragae]MCV7401395.1 hypothetical protein [Mycobacterium fragae]ORV56705.1 hypothetical protein AWC06_00255 [Mycobacterium fragae]
MASTKESHTTPPGLNVMAILLVLAVLAVAFGCWVDDEIRRHAERHGAPYHGLPGAASNLHPSGTVVVLGDAKANG